ncbi:putative quinol monooxygenase [Eilatimonas milleporae]|uniref:Autoinducer 2-degrading protein n=1 Tax=Eilatimonas milleporae TaxID=911205 RepID=A0A3M0D776_9PROT|nr:antibiotic biosynthesis monooxygenase [Eilatimonas milleporae]RMB12113.1 autoinducer 2-degrading protein [Eilatimonas milleporae]
MSYTFIARFKVFPDKKAAFIKAARQMEDAVRDREPGAIHYKFHRLDEPDAFAVIESFADEAAEQTHRQSDHFAALAPALIDCIDGTWTREHLHPLED